MTEPMLWLLVWWLSGFLPIAALGLFGWLGGEDLELRHVAGGLLFSLLGALAFVVVLVFVANEALSGVNWRRVVLPGRKTHP